MQGTVQKIINTTLIFPIYLLNISICYKKHLFYTNSQVHSIHTRSTVSTQDPQYPHKIHSIHTRFKTNLHPPTANLTKFQKAVYYSAIKIFNNLPHEIKDLANDMLAYQNALKRFLLANSFYNSKEYFNCRRRSIVI